jgi:hypothetical protein
MGIQHPDYVREAMEVIHEPRWDADLVALHYAAVKERIEALDSALSLATEVDAVRGRFEKAEADVRARLADVRERADASGQPWEWRWRVRDLEREDLDQDVAAFADTVRGVAENRDRIRADRPVLRRYKSLLEDLGAKSFLIRVQRTLDAQRLHAAYGEAETAVLDVGRWLTFRGERHLGTFVARQGIDLLLCVGVLLASVVAVFVGRRGLDRVLRHMAARVPALRAEPVTVRAEEAQAKREHAMSEAAAREAEEAALREVSKEEASRPQRMGEGGYGSGGDS